MIRILNAESLEYSPDALAILQEIAIVDSFSDLTPADLYTLIPNYDVLITRLAFQIDARLMDHAVRLHTIVTATTGLNHIDLAYAQHKQIKVLSLKGELEFLRTIPSTAEHTWALLLSLVRHIPHAYQSVLDNQWDRDRFRGNQLLGKPLGILGFGRIGEKVARYALAFGMKVYAYDPNPVETSLTEIFWCHSMEELLHQSEVLSIHVPFDSTTHHLLSIHELMQLPRHAFIINTARGGILNEKDVVDALESGHLRGLAVDVLEDEYQLNHSPLLQYARNHANVIITPHIGGATLEAMAMTKVFMANKLVRYLKEKR